MITKSVKIIDKMDFINDVLRLLMKNKLINENTLNKISSALSDDKTDIDEIYDLCFDIKTGSMSRSSEAFDKLTKLFESKKSAKKSLKEGLRYDSLTLELIQDDIELYFENKGYDVKIIDSGMAKALNVSYIYICKGKDFNKIKSDDLYGFLYSDVINGLLYHNDDFNVVVKNKQIMIILPKTRDYTESKKSAHKSIKEENNRQKVTEGIMNYFKGAFPLIEKDDVFRFSMYTKKDVMIGVELFKDYIFVGIFNLNGKNNLDEYIEIPRETYGTIEDEILYDSDAIWEYLEDYKLVK